MDRSNEILNILLEGGCSIEGDRYRCKLGKRAETEEEKSVKCALLKDFSKNSDHIETIRKMQMLGYQLSSEEKSAVVNSLAKDRYLGSYMFGHRYNFNYYNPTLNIKEEVKKILDIQQPMPLQTQSRISLRRTLMEKGHNVHQSVKELGLPTMLEDMILYPYDKEVQSCYQQFDFRGMKAYKAQNRPRVMFRRLAPPPIPKSPAGKACWAFVDRVTRVVQIWKKKIS